MGWWGYAKRKEFLNRFLILLLDTPELSWGPQFDFNIIFIDL